MKMPEHKPKRIEHYVGHDDPNNPLFYLDEWQGDSPQCLLFSGAPGLGKTTAAYLIAQHFNLDLVELNASDERGIDAVRNKIKEIAYTSSLWNPRLILLDEFEGMTKPAQDALKRMMEKSNCWWILTCNDFTSVIPAILSRCVHFKFQPYNEKQVRAYMEYLVDVNGHIPKDSPAVLQKYFNGDLRAIANHYLSGATIEQEQTDIASLSLDIAAGDWQSTHKTMLELVRQGTSLHYLMMSIHQHVKSVGMTSEQLYTFFVVWGDFVLRMNAWPLSMESFVDYFVASLYNEDKKTKTQ